AQGQLTDGTFGANGELVPLSADHHWQAQLWQAVRARIGCPSPPEQLPGLLQGLRDGTLQPAVPERVSLFGLGSIAPNLLAVLRALAEARDVHVFLRHPSHVVWANSPRRLAGGLVQRAIVDTTSYVRHPLIESWGRPSLEARALVGGATDIEEVHHGPESLPVASTVLQALQRGIRLDLPPALDATLHADDGSLQVHACHGEVRQLEVLRDALGHAFVADPTLQPHEVLVLCGDLERFAPLVEAVFTRGTLPVPVRVGDRSLSTADPVGSALQSVLSLVSGRATLSEVLALVQHEPVRRRFGWSVEHVEQFADWCSRLGTRWGLTPDHRMEWGLPRHVLAGTWSTMVDRLMAGAAMPAPTPRVGFGDVPPYDDMGADEVELAGTVAELLCRLTDLHAEVRVAKPIDQWVSLLHVVIDDFCAFDPAEPWRRQRVHRQVEQLLQSAYRSADGDEVCDIPLSLPELQSALNSSLDDSPGRLSLRSGSVTVTSFLPQHGVPARVVCLLGLDENALRAGVFDGDDVLGLHPCLGERHPRFEARQRLLDAVMSARERLIITCNGSDLTTNKDIPLAVPLVELLDVVAGLVPLDTRHAPVVVRHPRHGFNERALVAGELVSGSQQPFTFDLAMLNAAVARRSAHTVSPDSVSSWLLPPAIIETVELQRLLDVVANPSKVYLRDRLDVRLPSEAEGVDDGLSLSVDPLTGSSMGRELLAARLAGKTDDDWFAAARLDGRMPPGELSGAVLKRVREEVEELLALAAAMSVDPAASGREEIRIELRDGFGQDSPSLQLQGVVTDTYRSGGVGTVVRVQYKRARPSHRYGLALQLAALELGQPGADWSGVLIDRGSKKPTAVRLRLVGRGSLPSERKRAAESLLRAATSLFSWAMRDAVPFFDHVSLPLSEGDFNAVDSQLGNDLRDDHVSALWPALTVESLRWDPVLADDPQELLAFDDVIRGRSRAELVAHWLWDTYRGAVVETDVDDDDAGSPGPVAEVGE
ncbi:MAG: hypothetical protein RI900_1551, partial [Actinomycetota bacterium]